MDRIFYVRDRFNGRYLNRKGGWSRDLRSYRLAEFATEEEATNAIPSGTNCRIEAMPKREVKQLPEDLIFTLNHRRQPLGTDFKFGAVNYEKYLFFKSIDDALDWAESQSLDLDDVHVSPCPLSPLGKVVFSHATPQGFTESPMRIFSTSAEAVAALDPEAHATVVAVIQVVRAAADASWSDGLKAKIQSKMAS